MTAKRVTWQLEGGLSSISLPPLTIAILIFIRVLYQAQQKLLSE